MPLRVKLAVVVLTAIFVVLAILLFIGREQKTGGTDSDNSNVTGSAALTQ
jgi:hypothetical protein